MAAASCSPREEDKGSVFTVQLPLATRPPPPVPDADRSVPTKRLRVLVVDDEPHILHYMRATLEAWGHIPVVASDGAEALAVAADDTFDLVISDLRMPRLSGREFYEELVRRRPELAARLVFSTGDTVRGDTLAFLESLDRPYLHKPFSLAELRSLLGEVARAQPYVRRRDSRLAVSAPGDVTGPSSTSRPAANGAAGSVRCCCSPASCSEAGSPTRWWSPAPAPSLASG